MYFGGVQAARRVTRSVWDPPRYSVAPAGVSDHVGLHLVELNKQCSTQPHGVPNQLREAALESEDSLLLESVALYTEAI